MKDEGGAIERSRYEARIETRRTWKKPRIVSRERLEVVAAVCSPGKGPLELGDCLLNTNS